MEYAKRYFEEVIEIAKSIDLEVIEKLVQIILRNCVVFFFSVRKITTCA